MYDSNYALLQSHSFDDSIRFQRNRQYASKLLIWNLYHLLSMLLQYSPTNVVLLANSIGRLDVDYVCTIEISSWARLLLEIASTNTRAKKKKKKKVSLFHIYLLFDENSFLSPPFYSLILFFSLIIKIDLEILISFS